MTDTDAATTGAIASAGSGGPVALTSPVHAHVHAPSDVRVSFGPHLHASASPAHQAEQARTFSTGGTGMDCSSGAQAEYEHLLAIQEDRDDDHEAATALGVGAPGHDRANTVTGTSSSTARQGLASETAGDRESERGGDAAAATGLLLRSALAGDS